MNHTRAPVRQQPTPLPTSPPIAEAPFLHACPSSVFQKDQTTSSLHKVWLPPALTVAKPSGLAAVRHSHTDNLSLIQTQMWSHPKTARTGNPDPTSLAGFNLLFVLVESPTLMPLTHGGGVG